MSDETNKAMQLLNQYDYHSGKSAQEAVKLLDDLKELFTSSMSTYDRLDESDDNKMMDYISQFFKKK